MRRRSDPPVRTSENSPLRFDSVRPESGGEMGMTICPGKHEDSAYSGRWERDLDIDVAAIAKWGASAVVTLMQEHELAHLEVSDLGEAVERAGMDWHFLPIKDVNIPDQRFEALWTYSGHVLRRSLADGKKVLIHCKGGLGRTGMIAARLLVELGESPVAAIVRIREARRGAIETTQQEEHVLRSKAPRTPPEIMDRVLGCLLGGAVGDAFGYAVEFDHWRQIKNRFGAKGIIEPEVEDGQILVSDDTQMTLFTLEALTESSDAIDRKDIEAIVERIRLAYLDWLGTQSGGPARRKPVGPLARNSALRHQRAPGPTCLTALEQGARGTPHQPINNSKGCGGVMRIAPIGLMGDLDPAQSAELAACAAALTHGHPSGYISAAALAAMVRLMLDGADMAEAAKDTKPLLAHWKARDETEAKIEAALRAATSGSRNHLGAVESLGQGWVAEEALAIGLYSALAGDSFPEVLRIAANHDGDSDSTASIAGQIYGARKGLADLPNRWVRRLDVLSPALKLVNSTFV